VGIQEKNQQYGSIRYRARCVARGFMQIPGLDFTESFAPVASNTSIKRFSALWNRPKMNIQQSHSYPCIFYKNKQGKLVLTLQYAMVDYVWITTGPSWYCINGTDLSF
jgi:Reverse transcriptase (RNA-dependent DNA polymerase)